MLDESVNGLEQAAARQSRKPGGETSAVVSASADHEGNGMKVVSGGLKGVLGKSSQEGWEVVTAPSLPQFKVSLDNPLRLMVGFWICAGFSLDPNGSLPAQDIPWFCDLCKSLCCV